MRISKIKLFFLILLLAFTLVGCDSFSNVIGNKENVVIITNVEYNSEDELILTFSDGSTKSLGKINGKDGINGLDGVDGTGIDTIIINSAGELEVKLTNGETKNLGLIIGSNGKDGQEIELKVENGKVFWSYKNFYVWTELIDLETLKGAQGTDGISITNTYINEAGELILTFSNNSIKNLGIVIPEDGKDGIGISSTIINERGEFIVTLSNGEIRNLGKIGLVDGKDGREVELKVNNGFIQWSYKDSNIWVNLVDVETLIGEPGTDGIGITNSTINENGELVLTFSNNEIKNLGAIIGRDGKEIELKVEEGFLVWSYQGMNDWTNLIDTQSLVGASGVDGISITNSVINENGELVISYSDGTSKNLGKILKSYLVQFVDDNGHVLDVQHVLHGQAATAPTSPTRDGYTFLNWDLPFNQITSNIVIKATYEKNKYSVEFNSNGGTTFAALTDVLYGSNLVLPVPTKEGYDFKGWFVDDESNGKQFTNASQVDDNLNLYARWELKHFKVNFYDGDNNLIKTQYILYGGDATPPELSKTGYITTWNKSYSNVKSNLDITPIFTPITKSRYKVSHYIQSTDGLTYELYETDNLTGITNTIVSANIKDYPGVKFNFQHGDNHLNNTLLADNTLELAVYYSRIELSVSFYDKQGELIETKSVLYGGDVVAPTPPLVTGYSFQSWDQGLENITESKKIYSNYLVNEYIITLDVNGGNPLVENTINIVYDGLISGLVTPVREGYLFLNWKDIDNQVYKNGDVYKKDSNLTLIANWESINPVTYEDYITVFSNRTRAENIEELLNTNVEKIYYSALNDQGKQIYDDVINHIRNSEFGVSYQSDHFGVNHHEFSESVRDVFFSISQDYKEIFWLYNASSMIVSGGAKTTISLEFDIDEYYINEDNSINYDLIHDHLVKFNARVAELTKYANDNYEENYYKIKYIHDWIILNHDYEQSSSISHSPIGALNIVENEGPVCEAYAEAFNVLLNKLNIPVTYAVGMVGEEYHAWNYVKMGDMWYLVDVTWDENQIFPTNPDFIRYEHFLRREYTISERIYLESTVKPSPVSNEDYVYVSP